MKVQKTAQKALKSYHSALRAELSKQEKKISGLTLKVKKKKISAKFSAPSLESLAKTSVEQQLPPGGRLAQAEDYRKLYAEKVRQSSAARTDLVELTAELKQAGSSMAQLRIKGKNLETFLRESSHAGTAVGLELQQQEHSEFRSLKTGTLSTSAVDKTMSRTEDFSPQQQESGVDPALTELTGSALVAGDVQRIAKEHGESSKQGPGQNPEQRFSEIAASIKTAELFNAKTLSIRYQTASGEILPLEISLIGQRSLEIKAGRANLTEGLRQEITKNLRLRGYKQVLFN